MHLTFAPLRFLLLGLLAFGPWTVLPHPLAAQEAPKPPSTLGPEHVAIVFNKKAPASQAVALAYAIARNIDPSTMIGLDCPTGETITRKEFRDTIQDPLRKEFSDRNWWQIAKSPNGLVGVEPKKRVIALIHGMPLRISRDATQPTGKTPQDAANEASVDSELMILGLFDAPIASALNNPYFKKKEDFATFGEKAMYLVARIDGPDADVAMRLATEAAEIEKEGGPWGRTVLDLYGKGGGYQMGDDWIARIFNQSWDAGIPAQIDRHPATIPDFYPLTDCAFYFGWYEFHRNGFLLDPKFRFRPGAIAVHLHSFSAESLRTTEKFWAGPILARGATATLGNVWEPYLGLTHHFDQFHAALLEGYTLAEAAGTSMPVTSWMNVVIGDPLYRPFARRQTLDATTLKPGTDATWMAIRVALARWKDDPEKAAAQLREAGIRNKDGNLLESAGWLEYKLNRMLKAQDDFDQASKVHAKRPDQLRCRMHVAEALLARQQKTFALSTLREAKKTFADLPQVKAVDQHLLRLDPPPPPPKPAPPAPAPAPKQKP